MSANQEAGAIRMQRPPGTCSHSPLWSLPGAPSEVLPSSGRLPAASGPAASPGLKLPFRVRMIGDLVVERGVKGPHTHTCALPRTPTASVRLHPAEVPGAGRDMRLKLVAHIRLLASLQLAHVRCILLARVIQFAALAEHLEVHWQWSCLHVHQLVIGDGGLQGTRQIRGGATPLATPTSASPSHSPVPSPNGKILCSVPKPLDSTHQTLRRALYLLLPAPSTKL